MCKLRLSECTWVSTMIANEGYIWWTYTHPQDMSVVYVTFLSHSLEGKEISQGSAAEGFDIQIKSNWQRPQPCAHEGRKIQFSCQSNLIQITNINFLSKAKKMLFTEWNQQISGSITKMQMVCKYTCSEIGVSVPVNFASYSLIAINW